MYFRQETIARVVLVGLSAYSFSELIAVNKQHDSYAAALLIPSENDLCDTYTVCLMVGRDFGLRSANLFMSAFLLIGTAVMMNIPYREPLFNRYASDAIASVGVSLAMYFCAADQYSEYRFHQDTAAVWNSLGVQDSIQQGFFLGNTEGMLFNVGSFFLACAVSAASKEFAAHLAAG